MRQPTVTMNRWILTARRLPRFALVLGLLLFVPSWACVGAHAEDEVPPQAVPDWRTFRDEIESLVAAQTTTPGRWLIGTSPTPWIEWSEPQVPRAAEDPVLDPLRASLYRIEAVERSAREWAPLVPALGTQAWESVLQVARAQVQGGLYAVQAQQHPVDALQDHAEAVLDTVRFLLFDRMWTLTAQAGLELRVPWMYMGDVRRITRREFRDQVRRALDLTDFSDPWIVIGPRSVDYAFGFQRDFDIPPENALPPHVRPLVDAQVHVERMRAFAEAEVVAGRAGAASYWKPALDKAQALVLAGLFDVEQSPHPATALGLRFETIRDRVAAVFLEHLWRTYAADRVLQPFWAGTSIRVVRDGTGARTVPAGQPIEILVEAEQQRMVVVPSTYETVEETVVVTPGRYEMRDGKEVWVPPVYETRSEQVCTQPASTRVEVIPGRYLHIDASEAFGDIRHVWFIDRFTYDTRKRYRPATEGAWDRQGALPPQPPWIDLLVNPGALARGGGPLREGYWLVVGTKGARGPEWIPIGSKEKVQFPTCTRTIE